MREGVDDPGIEMLLGKFSGSRLVCPVFGRGRGLAKALARHDFTRVCRSCIADLGSSCWKIGERTREVIGSSSGGDKSERVAFKSDCADSTSNLSTSDNFFGI